jgi:hypothetical protein
MCGRFLCWNATVTTPRISRLLRFTVATSAAFEAELETLFQEMTDRLERSDIVFEFSCHHAVCAHPAAAVKARAASAGAGRSWGSPGTACLVGKPGWSGRRGRLPIALFCNPSPLSRPVGACDFLLNLVCTSRRPPRASCRRGECGCKYTRTESPCLR